MPIDFDLPTDVKGQLLAGALFAESSTKFYGGGVEGYLDYPVLDQQKPK